MILSARKTLYTILVTAYVVGGFLLAGYSSIGALPDLAGYAVKGLPDTVLLKYASVESGEAVLVATNASGSLVYYNGQWFFIEDFRASAACMLGDALVAAGSYVDVYRRVTPAVLVLNASRDYIVRLSVPGRFYTVACGDSLAIAVGSGLGPVAVMVREDSIEALKFRGLPSPQVIYADAQGDSAAIYVSSFSFSEWGYVIVYDKGSWSARSFVRPGNLRVMIRGIAAVNGGALVLGEARGVNWSAALLAPVTGGDAILVNTSSHGGYVLSADLVDGRIRAYYRPGAYWDGMLEIDPSSGRVWLSRLLWPYSHAVLYASMNGHGEAVTATTISHPSEGKITVVTEGFALRPSALWLDGEPLFYVKKPVAGEEAMLHYMPWPSGEPVDAEPASLEYTLEGVNASPVYGIQDPTPMTLNVDLLTILGLSMAYGLSMAGLTYYAFEPEARRVE